LLTLPARPRVGVALGGISRTCRRVGPRARCVALVIAGPAGGSRCATIGVRSTRDAIAEDAELVAPSTLRVRRALNATESRIAAAPSSARAWPAKAPASAHGAAGPPTCTDDDPDNHDAREPTQHI
jgi:hypothetical protein